MILCRGGVKKIQNSINLFMDNKIFLKTKKIEKIFKIIIIELSFIKLFGF